MSTEVHPRATVDPQAELGADVEIGPNAVITRWARIGDRVVIHPGAVIGGDPQFLGFARGTESYVEVGEGSVIRESVTINRSIHADGVTRVGPGSFLMACSHVGHDCTVADEVVLANGALLGGHVEVGTKTFVGGGAAVHQFCRLGEGVMIAGVARITKDVPPFCLAAERDELVGLNLVGLKRRGWSREVIAEIKHLFRATLSEVGNPKTRAVELLASAQTDQARTFLDFFAGSKRSIARPRFSEVK
jgi:UDP-N-acetylglucosamine acyltransferase